MANLERRRGYHPDHESMARFLMDPSKVGKNALEAAADVVVKARLNVQRALAADRDEDLNDVVSDGKRLEDSFDVESNVVVINDGSFSNPRRAARVVNDKRYAARHEFGSSPGHKNAHRSLRKAGAAVGELRGGIG